MEDDPNPLAIPRGVVPPRARVTQFGRWSWRIVIEDGLTEYGPGSGGVIFGWTSWGSRDRAERKADRILRRYLAPKDRDEFTVEREGSAGG